MNKGFKVKVVFIDATGGVISIALHEFPQAADEAEAINLAKGYLNISPPGEGIPGKFVYTVQLIADVDDSL